MLKTKPMSISQFFEADLNGVTEIQTRFLNEAKEFVYFRKGEFDNIVEILKAVTALVSLGAAIVRFIPDRDKEGKEESRQFLLRIISCKTEENEPYLKQFEELGAGVCEIPDEKRGRLRFFVNDNEFCLFVRRRENSFFGIIGDDEATRGQLQQLFESEYVQYAA
jgi:hypothetical protein